jgi:hypothetical protein
MPIPIRLSCALFCSECGAAPIWEGPWAYLPKNFHQKECPYRTQDARYRIVITTDGFVKVEYQPDQAHEQNKDLADQQAALQPKESPASD